MAALGEQHAGPARVASGVRQMDVAGSSDDGDSEAISSEPDGARRCIICLR